MAPRNTDHGDGIHITREMWELLTKSIEFNTSENRVLREKLLVQETKRAQIGTVAAVIVPAIVSILIAVVMKFLHL